MPGELAGQETTAAGTGRLTRGAAPFPMATGSRATPSTGTSRHATSTAHRPAPALASRPKPNPPQPPRASPSHPRRGPSPLSAEYRSAGSTTLRSTLPRFFPRPGCGEQTPPRTSLLAYPRAGRPSHWSLLQHPPHTLTRRLPRSPGTRAWLQEKGRPPR